MLPLDKAILQRRAGVPVIDAAENQIASGRVNPVFLFVVFTAHIPDDIDDLLNPLILPIYIRVHLIEWPEVSGMWVEQFPAEMIFGLAFYEKQEAEVGL